jgi:hypothetical protein
LSDEQRRLETLRVDAPRRNAAGPTSNASMRGGSGAASTVTVGASSSGLRIVAAFLAIALVASVVVIAWLAAHPNAPSPAGAPAAAARGVRSSTASAVSNPPPPPTAGVVVPETPTRAAPAPPCAGLSGSYTVTRARSTTSPGSCSPNLRVAPSIPIQITADPAQSAGYKVEVGYSDVATGVVTFIACVNNVGPCSIAATCKPPAGTDQVTLTFNGDSLVGTISRTEATSNCTVNFDLKGLRR